MPRRHLSEASKHSHITPAEAGGGNMRQDGALTGEIWALTGDWGHSNSANKDAENDHNPMI